MKARVRLKTGGFIPNSGRLAGAGNPRTMDSVAKNRDRIIGVTLRSALAGNADAARLCFQLIGVLPVS